MTLQRYRIAGIAVDAPTACPFFNTIAEAYREEAIGPADITLKKEPEDAIPSSDAALAQYYGISFFRQQLAFGSMSFHASALSLDGEAYLFSAPSGTGKSTHAALWKQRFGERVEIINDDKPALRIEGGRCYVYGTPWSGKAWINRNVKAPLKALVFLKRGSANAMRRLDPREALARVLEQSLCMLTTGEQMGQMCDILDTVLKTAPVYELTCTIDEQAAQLVYDTVTADCQENA